VKKHRNAGHDRTKRLFGDHNLIRHEINTNVILICEIQHRAIGETVSLQRLSTVLIEKPFGRARVHVKTRQKMTRIFDAVANQVSKKTF
jgi:hypothetical protein